MEAIRCDHLTFTYPMKEGPVLSDVSFSVEEAEFVLLCGKSGCGKTTLLRQLKKNLIPYGRLEGSTLYYGEPVEELDDRVNAAEIGFVQQNPDNQIVTDKVWHELAFGLESLGLAGGAIRRRVAEMASYFDIQEWFRRDVDQLSGGQKQLLNLASIMVMQPKLLILDEPTSQLDPIAASEFLRTVHKINRDLGVTVIMSEHRLEEAFTMADRVMVMDEGKILALDTPREIGGRLKSLDHPMFTGLPTVTRIYYSAESGEGKGGKSPLTVREGRLWLRDKMKGRDPAGVTMPWEDTGSREAARETAGAGTRAPGGEAPVVVSAKGLWFRYDKTGPDIVRDLNLQIRRGGIYCLLGGNGVGKSTLMKLLQGILKPVRGSVKVSGRAAMLPQNPQALFSEITVEEDLLDALSYEEKSEEEKIRAVGEMLDILEIGHLHEVHPYDLSGGEQQRLALGKVLLVEPEILLLDEPTKGLDPFFKITLAKILRRLAKRGITCIMVSHDIEFCAEFGDRCAMFFDGNLVSEGSPREFFAGNSFYTTTANRIAREYFPQVITWREAAECLRRVK